MKLHKIALGAGRGGKRSWVVLVEGFMPSWVIKRQRSSKIAGMSSLRDLDKRRQAHEGHGLHTCFPIHPFKARRDGAPRFAKAWKAMPETITRSDETSASASASTPLFRSAMHDVRAFLKNPDHAAQIGHSAADVPSAADIRWHNSAWGDRYVHRSNDARVSLCLSWGVQRKMLIRPAMSPNYDHNHNDNYDHNDDVVVWTRDGDLLLLCGDHERVLLPCTGDEPLEGRSIEFSVDLDLE